MAGGLLRIRTGLRRAAIYLLKPDLRGKYIGHYKSLIDGIRTLNIDKYSTGEFLTVKAPNCGWPVNDARFHDVLRNLMGSRTEIAMLYDGSKKIWVLAKGSDNKGGVPSIGRYVRSKSLVTLIHNHPQNHTPFPSGADILLGAVTSAPVNIIVSNRGIVFFNPARLNNPNEDFMAFGWGEDMIRDLAIRRALVPAEVNLVVAAFVKEKGRNDVDPANPALIGIMDKLGITYAYRPFS
jgi:hypothetical protein